jgi:hypothetical protein
MAVNDKTVETLIADYRGRYSGAPSELDQNRRRVQLIEILFRTSGTTRSVRQVWVGASRAAHRPWRAWRH